MKTLQINPATIQLDSSLQGRISTDAQLISDYSLKAEMSETWPFPAVTLFEDTNGEIWIGDGFHRVQAALATDTEEILAEVHEGGKKDAFRHALGANAHHGKRRTNADIKHAVTMACLEWPMLSDRAIAQIVKVTHKTIAAHRPLETKETPKLGLNGSLQPARTLEPRETKLTQPHKQPLPQENTTDLVPLNETPSICEILPWVDPIPTYAQLSEGSGIKTVEHTNHLGEKKTMVHRSQVIEWCKTPLEDTSEPRWAGFRPRPISLEHAEKERARYKRDQRLSYEVEKLSSLRDKVESKFTNVEIPFATLLISQVVKSIPRDAIEIVAKSARKTPAAYMEKIEQGQLAPTELVLLLISTEVSEKGFQWVEKNILTQTELNFN